MRFPPLCNIFAPGWWWWWWWWIAFVVWLTDEKRLALFPAATILRDPYHRESQTHREQEKLKDWETINLEFNLEKNVTFLGCNWLTLYQYFGKEKLWMTKMSHHKKSQIYVINSSNSKELNAMQNYCSNCL